MNKEEIQVRIDTNRDKINDLLSHHDLEFVYMMTRFLAAQNEQLLKKLKVLK